MRAPALSFVILLLSAGAASADTAANQTLFAERTALLAADRSCGLFTPQVRSALEASAWQVRGALLRAGWTERRAEALRAAAMAEGGAHRCDDPRVRQAAASAQAGFARWSKLPSMRFPGAEGAWAVRRTPDADGFTIRQDAASGAVLGVNGDALVLALPAGASGAAARLVFRDKTRAPSSMAEIPGRVSSTLSGRLPPQGGQAEVWAQARRVDAKTGRVRFVFPLAAAQRLATLDPREALKVEVDARASHVFEIGDLAAAMAFLGLPVAR